MVAKTEQATVKQVLRRYFKGVPEPIIAKQHKISQATVSRCGMTFTKRMAIVGIEKAAKEYGIMNEVKELRQLAKELYKSNATISDALAGVEMVSVFNEFEVIPKDYKKLAKIFYKATQPGFPEAALKLVATEDATGKPYAQILAEYEELEQKIVEANQALSDILEQTQKESEDLSKLKQLQQGLEQKTHDFIKENTKMVEDVKAEQDTLLAEVELTKEQIAAIHPVVDAGHKLGITDDDMMTFIGERLKLSELGLTPEQFEKVAIALAESGELGAKNLLDKLKQFGSLEKVNLKLQAQNKANQLWIKKVNEMKKNAQNK